MTWQRGGTFRQTSAQREFAQALGRLMMEQNHGFAAAGLAMMKGDIIIFDGVDGLRQTASTHIGAGAHEDRAGTTDLTLRFRLVRSGSTVPADTPDMPEITAPCADFESTAEDITEREIGRGDD